MTAKKKVFCLVLLLMLALPTGCGGTKTEVTELWKDPAYKGGYVKKVMVVALFQDPAVRRSYEAWLAKRFSEHGVNATVSYKLVPQGKDLKAAILKEQAQKNGVDKVMVTHLMGLEAKEIHSRGRERGPGHHNFNHIYPFIHNRAYDPVYYQTKEYLSLASDLYDVKTERRIWSATTKTVNANNVKGLVDSLSGVIINGLVQNRIIP